MVEGLVVNQGVEETVRGLLRSVLKNGQVAGVLALGRTGDPEGGWAYSLFTDPEAFSEDGAARPLAPFMPANAGGLLSRLTLKGAPAKPVVAVVRPCELHAFVELVKLNQSSPENILLISSTCSGVYPLDVGVNGDLQKKLPGYWDGVKEGTLDDDVRPTCRACVNFVPQNADITVALLGETDLDTECRLYVNTEKGAELVKGLEGAAFSNDDLVTGPIGQSRDQREGFREELFAGIEVGLQGLIRTFGRCIGCHACKTVCPICYCQVCTFDSPDCEHPTEFYEGELARKGGLRMPPNTIFFQLGRMAHMTVSCVGCGMCTDVCPADIPLSTLFSKVAASAQALFDYRPGHDVDEEIPLRTFEAEELAQVAT